MNQIEKKYKELRFDHIFGTFNLFITGDQVQLTSAEISKKL